MESFNGRRANSTSVSASLVRVVSMATGFPLVVAMDICIGVSLATEFCSTGTGRGVLYCGVTWGGGEMEGGEGWEGAGSVFIGGTTPPVLCRVMLAMLLRESALWRLDT